MELLALYKRVIGRNVDQAQPALLNTGFFKPVDFFEECGYCIIIQCI